MAETTKTLEQNSQHENRLTFENRVLEKIANYSVKNIEGILELKGNLTSGVKSFFSSNDSAKGVSAEVGVFCNEKVKNFAAKSLELCQPRFNKNLAYRKCMINTVTIAGKT